VRVCAQGVASYLQQANLADRGLLIGYDTRFASADFATAAAEVIAGNGIKVYLCSRAAPTPVISFGTRMKRAGGAIIITASHNPAIWNGLKFKTEDGASASNEVTAAIEGHVSQIPATAQITQLPLAAAVDRGLIEPVDLDPAYCEQLGGLIDLDGLRQARLDVVVDSMYGAGAGYFRRLLSSGNIKIKEINSEPNPLFPGIQPEPIAAHLTKLAAAVKRRRAGVGLATDGDADRIGIVDERGRFLTQLQVFALLALYMLEIRGERGPIVKTITTTSMLYRLGELFQVPVYETAVGFKYVAPVMLARGALIGGEESGGYGFRGHIPERDGILAGLYFLDLMVRTGKTPSALIDYLYTKVGPHYYYRMDTEFPEAERPAIIHRLESNPPQEIDGVPVVTTDTDDGYRFTLADTSWLLIRFSGTEPVLRIYAETDSQSRAQRLVTLGKEITGI